MSIPFCSLLKSGCKTCNRCFVLHCPLVAMFCLDRIKIVISTPTGSSLCGWFCWRWACSLRLSVPSQPLWVSCQKASFWIPLQVLKVDRSDAIFQGGQCGMALVWTNLCGVSRFKGWGNTLERHHWKMIAKGFSIRQKAKPFPKLIFICHSLSQVFSRIICPNPTLAFILFPDISNTWSSRKKEMGHVTCACFSLVCL